MFLAERPEQQVGTMALVPQIADAVPVPVIAAGGIADGRGLVAALALGASAAQIGTGYLRNPEAATNALYRAALKAARDDQTAIKTEEHTSELQSLMRTSYAVFCFKKKQ